MFRKVEIPVCLPPSSTLLLLQDIAESESLTFCRSLGYCSTCPISLVHPARPHTSYLAPQRTLSKRQVNSVCRCWVSGPRAVSLLHSILISSPSFSFSFTSFSFSPAPTRNISIRLARLPLLHPRSKGPAYLAVADPPGAIPLVPTVSSGGDAGRPVMVQSSSQGDEVRQVMRTVGEGVWSWLASRPESTAGMRG